MVGQQKGVRHHSDRLVAGQPAKYMDPVTGKTWTGRGRRPRWLEGREDAYRIGASEGLILAHAYSSKLS
ncbi:H-NS histone family protein [Cupriavidus basilensis]